MKRKNILSATEVGYACSLAAFEQENRLNSGRVMKSYTIGSFVFEKRRRGEPSRYKRVFDQIWFPEEEISLLRRWNDTGSVLWRWRDGVPSKPFLTHFYFSMPSEIMQKTLPTPRKEIT